MRKQRVQETIGEGRQQKIKLKGTSSKGQSRGEGVTKSMKGTMGYNMELQE